jgi:stearoyl-CoA desaturase (delta-9 desaturase)
VDDKQDPYNISKGFWWAHMGWIFYKDELPIANVGDLASDPLIRLQHRFYIPLATFAGFVLPAAIGTLLGDFWGGLLLAGFLRLVLLWHATACVNSVAHSMGAQPYSDGDSSRDSALTALITMGEGYHNYHHTFPFDYRNGVRAWQFDPTKWMIRVLACVGVAKDLVRAPQDAVIKARLRMQEKHARERLGANPIAAVRLRALREQLERLAEAREALRADWLALRTRAAAGTSRALVPLRAEMDHVSHRFREAYATWRFWCRDPASPRAT